MRVLGRPYPRFALCGLNCGLCPRHHTAGSSRCPGCGGADFHLKHPTCAVMTCNLRHDAVEYCFQCRAYPCDRYREPGNVDSFITYQNVIADLEKARTKGIKRYREELNRKVEILEFLLVHYDDGRRKNFYCLAVNLLPLSESEKIVEKIERDISGSDAERKEKIGQVVGLYESIARKCKIALKLRK